ncbi:MAG TPA: OmpH family outer membrane protein [Sphingomicrobium sp.]|jgi:outer membrane protein|nr:OmpH family outer membrane protein [Sphingomicrobium sp.]
MKKLAIILAAVAGAVAIPGTANAQRAAILVVDTDRVLAECTACRAANTQLQSQVQQGRTRAQQLEASLKPEAEGLEKAVQALGTRQPDAALQQRITAFRTKQQQGATELQNRERTIQSTQAHVQQQIGTRLVQIVEQSRARRQASVVVSKNSTLASDTSIDITGEVLTALNQQLPAVSVTPLPQQQQTQPQGR